MHKFTYPPRTLSSFNVTIVLLDHMLHCTMYTTLCKERNVLSGMFIRDMCCPLSLSSSGHKIDHGLQMIQQKNRKMSHGVKYAKRGGHATGKKKKMSFCKVMAQELLYRCNMWWWSILHKDYVIQTLILTKLWNNKTSYH